MDEERFKLKADYDWWGVVDTKGEIKGEFRDCFSTGTVVSLLNRLYDENQRLKKENEHFRKVFGNKYDAYINGIIGGNVNEL